MVMAVAVAGAFSTHAMDKKAERADLVNGYIQLDPEGMSCQWSSTKCSTIESSVLCTVGHDPSGTQLFRIDASGSCVRPLYQPEND